MIYLDNAATTRVRPEARAAMATAAFGNPSSIHAAGRAARRVLEDARVAIGDALGGDPKGLVFTATATEADNLAVFGAAAARKSGGRRILVSAVEHPAVLESADELAKAGWEVVRIPVDSDGRVSVRETEKAMTAGTVLLSVMAGNNETGTLQPVEELAALAASRGVPFHTDAAQVPGRARFRLVGDLVTLSSHKIHGPRGAAALWVRPGTPLAARIVGGGQEFERRSGTENVEAVAGFAAAVVAASGECARAASRMEQLRRRLLEGLNPAAPFRVNGHAAERLPHILNVTFPGVDGEAIVVALDAAGVCVSSGSACASQSLLPSHVLRAMGRTAEETRASVRFSTGIDTTEEEIDRAARATVGVIARLRAIGLAPAERP